MKSSIGRVVSHIYFSCVLALSCTTTRATVVAHPEWPENCTFELYPSKQMKLASMSLYLDYGLSSEDSCHSLCHEDERCGLYYWQVSSGDCSRFYVSMNLYGEVGLPVDLDDNADYNMGSKECKEQLVGSTCKKSPVEYDRQYLVNTVTQHAFFLVTAFLPESFNSTGCQLLCRKYSDCQSVYYQQMVAGMVTFCTLYNVSITDMLESDRADEVGMESDYVSYPTAVTYEMYCGGGDDGGDTTEGETDSTNNEVETPTATTSSPADFIDSCPIPCYNGGKSDHYEWSCECVDNPTLMPPYCKTRASKMRHIYYARALDQLPPLLVEPLLHLGVRSLMDCAMMCNGVARCLAVHYDYTTRWCRLLDATAGHVNNATRPNNDISRPTILWSIL